MRKKFPTTKREGALAKKSRNAGLFSRRSLSFGGKEVLGLPPDVTGPVQSIREAGLLTYKRIWLGELSL